MARINIKGIWSVLKQSFKGFGDDKVTKLSASLAYYTVFSLGPLMIVLIFLAGFFFGREAIEGSIYAQMQSFVGKEPALELQQMVKNASISGKSTVAAIIGFVTLLVGATTVFAEIQDSINSIWGLKPKPNQAGWLLLLKNRLLSFSVIASLGFLLLVSLAVTAIIEALMNRLQAMFPDIAVVLIYIVNLLVTFAVITLLFGVIFKVLPDAKMKWKDVLAGAIATAILFMIGKFAISFYIGQSDVGSTYGAAGSLVVLLLWVYYSSIILYFGAEFTLAYSKQFGGAIKPNEYTVWEKQPAVAGAKAEFDHGEKRQLEQNNEDRAQVHGPAEKKKSNRAPAPALPAYQYFDANVPVKSKKKSNKPGMFTVFTGLLLYFVSSSAKK